MIEGRRTYIERAWPGWRLVAEASPMSTGLPLWTVVRRWRLGRKAVLRTRDDAERSLQESIAYHRQRIADRDQRRQREVL